MNRRRLLTGCLGSLSVFGGCLTDSTGVSTPTPENERRTDGPSPTPSGPESGVGVEGIVTRKAVTYSSVYGSGGVRADPDTQYIVASITNASKRDPPEFVLETESQTFESGLSDPRGFTRYGVAGYTRPYLVFPVPSPLSASNPRIRLTEGAGAGRNWGLPDEARAALEAPAPRFELDELDVPERVTEREELTVSLSVTNVSETDGQFLAAAYWPTSTVDDDESHIVDRTIPAGGSATASLTVDTRATDTSSNPVTLSVEGHVTASREVQVEEYAGDDGRATETPP